MDQNIQQPQKGLGLMQMFRLNDKKEQERQLELRRLMLLHQLGNRRMPNRDAYMRSAQQLLDLDLNEALFSRALQQNQRTQGMTY